MKRIIISLLLGSGVFHLHAQQDPLYGQYIFNNAIINPAQAGVNDVSQCGVLTRRQWLGMEGAPTTSSIFLNTHLPKNVGFAGGIYHDQIGPTKELTFQADFSTQVQLSEDWVFSGGIRTMASNVTANLSTLLTNTSGDPNFSTNFNSGVMMNMGAGVLFFTEKHFIGASMPRIFARNISDGNKVLSRSQSHLYIYGGSSFRLNEDFTFTPSMLLKSAVDAPLQFDLNMVFDYKDILDVGPMIRSKTAIGFLAGYKINTQLYLGYMYEYPINGIHLISNQTHEISLRVLWQSKIKNRVKSPRYFL